jgi:hypothetical protein
MVLWDSDNTANVVQYLKVEYHEVYTPARQNFNRTLSPFLAILLAILARPLLHLQTPSPPLRRLQSLAKSGGDSFQN